MPCCSEPGFGGPAVGLAPPGTPCHRPPSGRRVLANFRRASWWLAALWLAAAVPVLAASALAVTNAAVPVFHSSLKAASDAAAADQSFVLLVFCGDWSEPSRQLREKTLSAPEFLANGGALHVVEVNVDTEAALAREYDVETVPVLALLSAEQKIVARADGFLGTAELLSWLSEGRERARSGSWEGRAPSSKFGDITARSAAGPLEAGDIARLIELLGERHPADREAAAKLLLSLRDNAVLPLVGALTNSYLGIRIAAGEALRQLAPGSPAADPWQSPEELAAGAAALRAWWAQTGKLPAQTAPPAPDPAEAGTVALAIENLSGSDAGLRTRAMSALVSRGVSVLPAIRAALKKSDQAGDQRAVALLEDVRWAILVPDALDTKAGGVRNVLARGRGPERQGAAAKLGRAGAEAIPALSELVEDADTLVVEAAVRALSAIGGKDTVPAMAALLKSSDSNLRMTAAQALGHPRSYAAVPHLLAVIDDPNEVVACAALASLEEIHSVASYPGSRTSLPADLVAGIKRSLVDPRWRVRAVAAEIAGKLNTSELNADLQPLLDDPDGFVVKNALASLRKLGAAPDAASLARIAERHAGLRGEVVEILSAGSHDEAVQAVTGLYRSGGIDGRLAIVTALGVGSGDRDTTAWQPLLAQAAAEPDPRLRRAAAASLAAQPPKVVAAVVTPLLTDEDAETRSKAAGAILAVLGGERVFTTSSKGSFFDDFTEEVPYPARQSRSRTNEPAATPEQIAAWHEAVQKGAGSAPSPLSAAALFVTGDTNAGLPAFQAVLDQANKDALAELSKSAALSAILPRLPWPQGKSVLERFCAAPGLFLRMLGYASKGAPGITDFLLEPERFRAAVDPATSEELATALPQLLGQGRKGVSLLANTPRVTAVLTGLLGATNAAWRAAAVHALTVNAEASTLPMFLRALKDPDPAVRAAAVRGVGKSAKDRPAREQHIGPLLADPDKQVVSSAAMALLEPETRSTASVVEEGMFQYQGIHVWSSFGSSVEDQRPLATLEGKPAFLDTVRQRLQGSGLEDLLPSLALLLAQYGDFSGLDRVLALLAEGGQERPEFNGMVFAMIALSKDPKHLPYLQKMAGAMKQEYEYRQVLQALKGMTGSEARTFRLEINKKIRGTN